MSDKVQGDNSVQFSWGTKRRRGGTNKDVQFYESFTYDSVEYSLFDSVYLFKDDETEPYIGKLIKIWEHKNKIRRVKVLWFFRPHEVSNYLGDEKVLDNELFLACGDGMGLANVNPLEAIAGKCDVVCTSKDERNRQPSEYELMNADYIFYRTFDVKKLVISDKLGETISAVEVRYLLNKGDSQNSSGPKIDVVGSENGPKSLTTNGEKGPILERTDYGGGKTMKYDDSFDALMEKWEKPAECGSAASTIPVAVGSNSAESHCKFGPENISSSVSLKLGEVSAGNKPSKDVAKVNAKAPEKSKLNTSTRIFDAEENSGVGMTGTIFCNNGVKNAEEHSAGAHNKAQSELKDSKRLNECAEDLGPSDFKRAKIVNSGIMKPSIDRGWDVLQKSGVLPDYNDTEVSMPAASAAAGDKTKGKMAVENTTIDTLHKKVKEKISKVSSEKLQQATSKPYIDKGSITYGQLVEITRRPDADRSKWFTGIPWEDRVKNASEKGTLVLLQNLDPACTSCEVEDIIWHGCHESCSAKMIQRTSISSPHSGLAFGIFKTREAAENAVEKLEKGCLMLPHGRPLVGCIGSVSVPSKQSSFPGHLLIDKIKFQMQKGKKEAVSTSHSSQPNTLEYEMAMEWRLHQARSDFWWKKLHKQQGEELKKVKANLQLKRTQLG